jgi:hypothetical protein
MVSGDVLASDVNRVMALSLSRKRCPSEVLRFWARHPDLVLLHQKGGIPYILFEDDTLLLEYRFLPINKDQSCPNLVESVYQIWERLGGSPSPEELVDPSYFRIQITTRDRSGKVRTVTALSGPNQSGETRTRNSFKVKVKGSKVECIPEDPIPVQIYAELEDYTKRFLRGMRTKIKDETVEMIPGEVRLGDRREKGSKNLGLPSFEVSEDQRAKSEMTRTAFEGFVWCLPHTLPSYTQEVRNLLIG